MLEEILKSINLNLERIANSLEGKKEEKITTMREPIIPGQMSIEDIKPNVDPAANTIKISPIPMPNTTAAAPVPTTAQAESFTQEQLAVAMSNAVSAGKMNVISEILQKFNVQALTQINPNDYNKLATMLREAGVKV